MKLFTIDKGFMKGEGVIFESGAVCISWLGDINSIVIYGDIVDVEKLHKQFIVYLIQ